MKTPLPFSTEAGRRLIESAQTCLGIEFGSTRIKAVLTDREGLVLAVGSHDWENQLRDGLWTYPVEAIWEGMQSAYRDLALAIQQDYEVSVTRVGALGISAMMHGYLATDQDGNLLVPFRTWRNTNTDRASELLSDALQFSIPHRWSLAHLVQACLDQEGHLAVLNQINTLAGFVHQHLSDEFVIGIGDASGMFPIDSTTRDYDINRIEAAQRILAENDFTKPLLDLLPAVRAAGEAAGVLTARGALLLDPTGTLQAGALMSPPEGDAGTGMVATNTISPGTGNVSAGTSIFAMVVLQQELQGMHPELDMVTTPEGAPVAMVHSNNGASEWDQWVGVFSELLRAADVELSMPELYDLLYAQAAKGSPDGGELMSFNLLSGEPILGLDSGRPLIMRTPGVPLTLANFMRTQLMTIFAVLRIGIDILREQEGVSVSELVAHGGLFKSPLVSQQVMAAALDVPVAVSSTAGEGGAWGAALLAAYRLRCASSSAQTAAPTTTSPTLSSFLADTVFQRISISSVDPVPSEVAGFDNFLRRYRAALPVEEAASKILALPKTETASQ